jgi:predicted CXXCH cytochrome family protein
MKIYKLSLILVAAAAVVFGLSGTSFAFHAGGVAECMGCHEMHGANGANLLQGTDQSSTCLICHGESGQSSYHIATPDADMPAGTPPVNEGPGGDFGWLKKTYIYVVRNAVSSDYGYTHGHNIIAADDGYVVDPENGTAPGGTFPSAQLGCQSCHDMHGKGRWLTTNTYAKTGQAIYTSGSYGAVPSTGSLGNLATGVYRLLRGTGDTVDGVTYGVTPPVAVVNSSYNRSEYFTMTRTAYGSGMSEWCNTCHPDMHSSSGILRHPTAQVMSGAIQGNYNSYVKSGDMTGSPATSFNSLIPWEEGLTYNPANIGTLKGHAVTNDSQLAGPSGAAQVMCLSCHRAHATGWMEMTRWNNETTFIVNAGVYPAEQGRTSVETAKAYYDKNVTKFAPYQRNLCNKCHAKD